MKKSTMVWSLLIGILVLLNIAVLTKNFLTNDNNGFYNNFDEEKEEDFINELKSINYKQLNGAEDINNVLGEQKYKLIIIFRPDDCPACLHENKLWSSIYENLKINVIGILPYSYFDEVKMFLRNENISFPIYVDVNRNIDSFNDDLATPVKFLLDDDNEIVSIKETFTSKRDWKKYYNFIKSISEE